jgi:hypothetical protein
MKKGLMVFILLCLLVPLSFAESVIFRVFMPIDFGTNQSWYNSETGDSASLGVNAGLGIGAEALVPVIHYLQLGVGFAIPFGTSATQLTTATFSFDPIYAIARGVFPLGLFSPYVIVRAGYALFSGNDAFSGGVNLSGGFFSAFGVGFEVKFGKNLPIWAFAEINYALDTGNWSYEGASGYITYDRAQVAVGLAFGI